MLLVSGKCHCVRSNALGRCYIDVLKTTEDLIFRISLLLPAALAEHIKPKAKDLNTQAAALCAAAGVFVTAWQQQQVEAGLEFPNGRPANSVLIERLKNSDKYILTEIDEDGRENTSEYNKRTKALKQHFSSQSLETFGIIHHCRGFERHVVKSYFKVFRKLLCSV